MIGNFTLYVVDEMCANVILTKGFKPSTEALQQPHPKQYNEMELEYMSKLLWLRHSPAAFAATPNEWFSAVHNRNFYKGVFPSTHFLNMVWVGGHPMSLVALLHPLVEGAAGEVRRMVHLASPLFLSFHVAVHAPVTPRYFNFPFSFICSRSTEDDAPRAAVIATARRLESAVINASAMLSLYSGGLHATASTNY